MLSKAPQILKQLNDSVRTRLIGLPESTPFSPPARPHLHKAAPPLETEPVAELSAALKKTLTHLHTLQHEAGYWEAAVFDNPTITSEYVMFLQFLGILDEDIRLRAKNYLWETQTNRGGWTLYHGGPEEHSATIEAYFTLKLCGVDQNDPRMIQAKKLILEKGGIETSRIFTKINLAMFGEYSWEKIPCISPELMLQPRKTPFNIYEFSSWSRAVIIPLLIIFDQKPTAPLKENEKLGELWEGLTQPSRRKQIQEFLLDKKWNLEKIFRLVQAGLFIYEKSPIKPLRQKALKMAEKWILEHQDPNGNWGGIFPAMTNALVALKLRGYPLSHPRMVKGLSMLRSFADETESTIRVQSTVSPVWDTAITTYAMQETGVPPTDVRVQKSVQWLLNKQITQVLGDWRFKASSNTPPGGWPFEHENDQYPDLDDTALTILALLPSEQLKKSDTHLRSAIDRGIEWMLGMQGSDGGWGAFDRDNNRQIINQIPFSDLKSLLDPSTPDVTAHVMEALGAAHFDLQSKPIQKALRFLRTTQEENGSWFGRWGVNYIYGTGAVLSALHVLGVDMNQDYIQKSRNWLLSLQNADGGWGESCASYDVNHYVPLGYSTASQTAWAILALLACPPEDATPLEEGVRYLLKNQTEDGEWKEPEWTGTGFPKHFYLRYDYYRLYFPLLALGRYAETQTHKHSSPSK